MFRALPVALLAATVSAAAHAAARPHLLPGASYPTARRQLMAQNFVPVRIIDHGDRLVCSRYADVCRAFPEVVECTGAGASFCMWLYRNRTNGRYWIIVTRGDPDTPSDVSRLRYDNAGPADRPALDGLTVAGPNGRPFRFAYPPKPVPLCREGQPNPETCWIKPPPDYRPAPPPRRTP
ncbi:hypothetical protein [Phenylobacterium sp.]|uniref:hypothetical protein n=1 Tax=Phenylobacterium sp. TaxID=1871053 RepID=UPI0025E28191|nr:hypothetical protein [Phenylobacterium sp.]MBX3484812.1 hypothetical protein [Phenylobacterium sp.]